MTLTWTQRHMATHNGQPCDCAGTSAYEVAPPRMDDEGRALLEAASYGGRNPEANARVAAARARNVTPKAGR